MKKSIFSVLVFSFFVLFLAPIAKVGWCPAGYKANGNYCMATGNAKPAMPKTNAFCPSGYKADGNYCVQR